MENFHFTLPAGILLPNMVINIFVGLQLFIFLCFLFLLPIRQDILSTKSRNALLLNIGRVRLINGYYQTVHPPPLTPTYSHPPPLTPHPPSPTQNKFSTLVYQRAKRHANFSFLHANVPKGVSIFQIFLLRNAKGNFYTYYMKNSTLYLIS